MGLVYVDIQVGNEGGGDMVNVPEVLVDTGSAHTVLPAQSATDYRNFACRASCATKGPWRSHTGWRRNDDSMGHWTG